MTGDVLCTRRRINAIYIEPWDVSSLRGPGVNLLTPTFKVCLLKIIEEKNVILAGVQS